MNSTRSRATEAASFMESGLWTEAASAYADVISGGGSDYRTHYSFGSVLLHCHRLEAAHDQFTTALTFQPDSIEALHGLAITLSKTDRSSAAEDTFRRIIALRPDIGAVWCNFGLVLIDQGRSEEGVEALQRAFELTPDDPIQRDNLLLALNYIATDGQSLGDAHRLVCEAIPSGPKAALPVVSGRRIRVGYVSSDFRSHSVSFFMAGPIMTHDPAAFEIFCYSTTLAPDRRTEDFRHLTEHFKDLATCSDAESAREIISDRIDILVDLGGHSGHNRLGIFSHRPAPVQVTYLGYPATTGCSFIDYRMVDALTDPEGSEGNSTEQLVRLPAPFLCYYPHSTVPTTGPLPALANGYVTFGSFNHSPKISDQTLDLWSRVLASVPDSRLFIKAAAFSDADIRDRFDERFTQRGIDPCRIVYSGRLKNAQDHLTAYGQIDIALDTFPYNGTTTTCEALWMGVPVISLVGDLHAARVGLTLLKAAGLGGFAARSAEEYVALAVALAADRDHLAQLRGNLQGAVAQSPLCDRFRLTEALEAAYRWMVGNQDHM